MTANDQESDQIKGYEAGAVDYITKSFSVIALQRKISAMFAMLEHHRLEKDVYDTLMTNLLSRQQEFGVLGKFNYTFPLLPMLVFFTALVLIALGYSTLAIRYCGKKSLAEHTKMME